MRNLLTFCKCAGVMEGKFKTEPAGTGEKKAIILNYVNIIILHGMRSVHPENATGA